MAKRDYRSYNIFEDEVSETHEPTVEIVAYEQTIEKESDRYSQEHALVAVVDVPVYEEVIKEAEEVEEKVVREKSEEIQDKKEQDTSDRENMSFDHYKSGNELKKGSRLIKWSTSIIKVIIGIMLLPLIGILAFTVLTAFGAGAITIVAVIGSGVILLGTVCFIATQISPLVIALGISASISALSLGGILLILFVMLIKGIFKGLSKLKGNQSINRRKVV